MNARIEVVIEVLDQHGIPKRYATRKEIPGYWVRHVVVGHMPLVYNIDRKSIDNARYEMQKRKGFVKDLAKHTARTIVQALDTPGIPSGR